jgi:calcineurin-like phosphoesterase family protein
VKKHPLQQGTELVPNQASQKKKLFVTADEHYRHAKIILYTDRPFENPQTMENTMVRNHNTLVRESDITIHIGDFCFGHRRDFIQIVAKLNGQHLFMDGSHDRALAEYFLSEDLCLGEKAKLLPKMFEFEYAGNTITLNHYAMTKWYKSHYGSFHFFGHSHGHHTPENRSMDVGVDCQNFRPLEIGEAIKMLELKKPEANHP